MKERVTLTIDREILGKVDKIIDGLNVRNRSHAIELVLSKYLNFRELKTAIILCGGEGTRLRPITYEIPKPLVPVHGKPIIEHIFDLLKKYGVTDIILSVGHMKEKILKEADGWSRLGLRIDHVAENRPMGTGGAIKIAGNKLPKTFIVSNGDELKSLNIWDMYEMHKKNKALATIALTTVEDPSAYGVARLDAQGRLFGFPFSGQWFDTGNLERYERALKNWKDIRPE
jgi:NDP-sugar pyrophosphorylase family protein